MQKRCPWCGKRVKTSGLSLLKETDQKKTPSRFIFLRCKSCQHFYGQNYKSPRVYLTLILTLLVSFFVLAVSSSITLMLIVLFLLTSSLLQMPLVRMTREETAIPKQEETFCRARVVEQSKCLRKNYIYPLTKDFDTQEAYSQISPIRIEKIDRKSGYILFSLLYDHCDNAEMLSGEPFSIFNNGEKIAVLVYIDPLTAEK